MADLRAHLGSAAVPCPTMDIGSSFTQIINKALGIDGFFPYNTDTNFLLGMLQSSFTSHSPVGRELIRFEYAKCCCLVHFQGLVPGSY